jgi:hypothetical protein
MAELYRQPIGDAKPAAILRQFYESEEHGKVK